MTVFLSLKGMDERTLSFLILHEHGTLSTGAAIRAAGTNVTCQSANFGAKTSGNLYSLAALSFLDPFPLFCGVTRNKALITRHIRAGSIVSGHGKFHRKFQGHFHGEAIH